MTGDDVVTWTEVADGVLAVTLDRRPANAFGPPIIRGLDAAPDEADRRGTRVLLLDSAFEVDRIQELFEHGEAAEGIAAFLEKRPPTFGRGPTGRKV